MAAPRATIPSSGRAAVRTAIWPSAAGGAGLVAGACPGSAEPRRIVSPRIGSLRIASHRGGSTGRDRAARDGVAMGPDQQRLTPTERADQVAYLDGELGDADARAIATKLSNSATARREVESLEKAWELLDHLPRPRAAEDFTARTLTEVARREVEAGELGTAVVRTTRRLVRALIWMVMSLLAF